MGDLLDELLCCRSERDDSERTHQRMPTKLTRQFAATQSDDFDALSINTLSPPPFVYETEVIIQQSF